MRLIATILVVKDLSKRELLRQYLQTSGGNVIIATNTLVALQTQPQAVAMPTAVCSKSIATIALNVAISKNSSFKLRRQLKNNPTTETLPIICRF